MPAILSALPGGGTGGGLFTPPPQPPRLNDPPPESTPPPLSLPRKKRAPKILPENSNSRNAPAALKSTHRNSHYYKPIPKISQNDPCSAAVLAADEDSGRSVVVGESGVSYLLPGAEFEFQFSYSETPKVRPLALREPVFLPFVPPSMPRPWTGKAPLLSKKEKEERRKKIRLAGPLGGNEEGEMVMEMKGGRRAMDRMMSVYGSNLDGRSREEVLGPPLKKGEVQALVKRHMSSNRQVNLGRDGLTHNMLELIHSHWRRDEVCKIRCRGVPTVDMDNVCYHVEEKTGGKIIHRVGGIIYLFRGRNYNYRTRPRYPVMLWKPATPVYPKLIQEAPEGLTKEEADELRRKGEKLLPICQLAKNGIYLNLVKDVRDAFEGSPLVKINCQGMHASDYKKLGAKLKELVPCVLLSFDAEQILMWRGRDWKPRFRSTIPSNSQLNLIDNPTSSRLNDSGQSNGTSGRVSKRKELSSSKMLSLWKRALDLQKAVLLDETEMNPDSLLKRVEEFERISQATEHSYPASIVQSSDSEVDSNEEDVDEGDETRYDDTDDFFEEHETSLPFGSLPIDSIAKRLR